MDIEQRVVHNFRVLCALYHFQKRDDLRDIHETALWKLRQATRPITPAHPVLSTTVFDGVNTRNKVLTILQSRRDLPEVVEFKAHPLYTESVIRYDRHAARFRSPPYGSGVVEPSC